MKKLEKKILIFPSSVIYPAECYFTRILKTLFVAAYAREYVGKKSYRT